MIAMMMVTMTVMKWPKLLCHRSHTQIHGESDNGGDDGDGDGDADNDDDDDDDDDDDSRRGGKNKKGKSNKGKKGKK